jgi:hypothetical protein
MPCWAWPKCTGTFSNFLFNLIWIIQIDLKLLKFLRIHINKIKRGIQLCYLNSVVFAGENREWFNCSLFVK